MSYRRLSSSAGESLKSAVTAASTPGLLTYPDGLADPEAEQELDMTDLADGELSLDGSESAIQQREAAFAAARRYLSFLAAADIPRLPAGDLRDQLERCRTLLEAVVEASRSREPLARTVDEAAVALSVSPLTVYRLVNSGDLAAYRISRRLIRIDEAALRSYLTGHAVGEGGVASSDIPDQHIRPVWE